MESKSDKNVLSLMLIERRILPNKKGYAYLMFVIDRLLSDKIGLSEAYEKAAKKFNVRANTVEKSISNAIEGSFGSMSVAEKYGKYASPVSGKITNKKYVSMIIEEIHNCKK